MATVLILDEETDSRILLKRLWELSGHHVIACSEEGQALEGARSGKPDLAIIHVSAGSRWSPGLLGLLKTAHERMKIMTIGDYVSDQIAEAAKADDFLAKPVDLETIERKFRDLLAPRNAGNSPN